MLWERLWWGEGNLRSGVSGWWQSILGQDGQSCGEEPDTVFLLRVLLQLLGRADPGAPGSGWQFWEEGAAQVG